MDSTSTPQQWRETLLRRLTIITLVLMVPMIVLSIVMDGDPKWAGIGFFYIALLLVSLYTPLLSYNVRASGLIALPLFNSLIILLESGYSGNVHLYAALGVMMSALLLTPAISFGIFVATAVVMSGVGFIEYNGYWIPERPQSFAPDAESTWVWFIVAYVASIGVILGSLQFISKRLVKSLDSLREANIAVKHSHEAELRSLEKYRLLSDNMTDIVWTSDLNMKLDYISPSIKQLGYGVREVERQGLRLLFNDAALASTQERVSMEVVNDEPEGPHSPTRWEAYIRSSDGTYNRYEFLTILTRNSEGRPDGLLNVARNIDDRRQADLAVSRMVNNLQDLQGEDYFLALVSGFAKELNCRMFAVTELASERASHSNTLAICKDGYILKNQGHAFIEAPEGNIHCRSRDKDQLEVFRKFPYTEGMSRYVVYPIRIRGEAVGLMLAFHDDVISDLDTVEAMMRSFVFHTSAEIAREHEKREKDEIQQQLFQSQKIESIGQLAGGIAHDFNNLLAVIRGYTELSMDPATTEPKRAEFLKQIHKATETAASLTSQILAFSRQQSIDPKKVDLNDVCRDLVPMLDRLLGSNFFLEFSPCEEVLPVEIDVSQIEQAIVNLVVNARDAMEHGGRVQLVTELCDVDATTTEKFNVQAGRYTRLRVVDYGSGIPDELLDRIFEPYFTTKPMGRGTGFGLAVYGGIVKQHEGFYAIECPGTGTIFDTYIPCADSVSVVEEKPKLKLVASGRESILVVEDNGPLLTLVREMLEAEGYQVLQASSCKKGIEMFDQNADDISLAILDVMLPDGNGFDVLAHIRGNQPDLPILFTSGFADDKVFAQEIADHNVEIIRKPYWRDDLLSKIRESLQKNQGQRLQG